MGVEGEATTAAEALEENCRGGGETRHVSGRDRRGRRAEERQLTLFLRLILKEGMMRAGWEGEDGALVRMGAAGCAAEAGEEGRAGRSHHGFEQPGGTNGNKNEGSQDTLQE